MRTCMLPLNNCGCCDVLRTLEEGSPLYLMPSEVSRAGKSHTVGKAVPGTLGCSLAPPSNLAITTLGFDLKCRPSFFHTTARCLLLSDLHTIQSNFWFASHSTSQPAGCLWLIWQMPSNVQPTRFVYFNPVGHCTNTCKRNRGCDQFCTDEVAAALVRIIFEASLLQVVQHSLLGMPRSRCTPNAEVVFDDTCSRLHWKDAWSAGEQLTMRRRRAAERPSRGPGRCFQRCCRPQVSHSSQLAGSAAAGFCTTAGSFHPKCLQSSKKKGLQNAADGIWGTLPSPPFIILLSLDRIIRPSDWHQCSGFEASSKPLS